LTQQSKLTTPVKIIKHPLTTLIQKILKTGQQNRMYFVSAMLPSFTYIESCHTIKFFLLLLSVAVRLLDDHQAFCMPN
jgi:hypothetical protein